MSHSNAKHTTPAATAGPRFVTGSLRRHIGVMAGAGAIGLVAIFAVDLVNLLYISMLGEQAIAAAVGFAGVVGFFHLSVFIGMLIGIAAVVSRAIGAQRMAEARGLATSTLVISAALALSSCWRRRRTPEKSFTRPWMMILIRLWPLVRFLPSVKRSIPIRRWWRPARKRLPSKQ